jgi:hypothetical protein
VKRLTSFGAWIILLIIAIEDEIYSIGRRQATEYLPLYSITLREWPAEFKDGKEVRLIRKSFASLLNGKTCFHSGFRYLRRMGRAKGFAGRWLSITSP